MKKNSNSEIKNNKNYHEPMSVINSIIATPNELLVNSLNLENHNEK
jgi:hypothetical protein